MTQETLLITAGTLPTDIKYLCIDDDFFLFERDGNNIKPHPFKVAAVMVAIGIHGESRGIYNLQPFVLKPQTMLVALPEQVLTLEYQSEDYKAKYIIMSAKFISSLGLVSTVHSFLSAAKFPTRTLNVREFDSVLRLYEMLQLTVANRENEYRMETVKHLTLAFYYGTSNIFNTTIAPHKSDASRHDWVVDEFMTLIQAHFKQERAMQFYADKLCITPKYLSILIKQSTGLSGNAIIDRRVALEAKALLKSTNMTIQQVSDELNFQSQSFFGKYFKRVVGMSPSEYKKL